ncbi:MAG: hypothetical protein IT378_20760 [Sandaracinaceae bacterium]|nr:hypothetical protein [Sandaracinaceae bacterium]
MKGVITLALRALGLFCAQLGLSAGLGLFTVDFSLAASSLMIGGTASLAALVALRWPSERGARAWAIQLASIVLLALGPVLAGMAWSALAPHFVLAAAIALSAPLVTRLWRERSSAGSSPASLALDVLAGPLAASLLAGAHEPLLLLLAVPALALASWAHRASRRAQDATEVWIAHVGATQVATDGWLRAAAAPPADAETRWVRDALEARAEEVSEAARADARARAQIVEARQLRTRFMAAMSHELRSPLNSIVGFAQLLEQGVDGPLTEGQRESVSLVRRAAQELISLLTDVLDLARLEAGRLVVRRAWTPSVEILTAVVEAARQIAEAREFQLEAVLQPGLPPVYADRPRTVQSVLALLRGTTSSLRRTTVRLVARVASGPPGPPTHLRIEIHDALGALAPDEVARIFEAFQEITEPTGRRIGGLGMALTLARGLVRLQGGEVWADALAGAGTVLCVALPLDGPLPSTGPSTGRPKAASLPSSR